MQATSPIGQRPNSAIRADLNRRTCGPICATAVDANQAAFGGGPHAGTDSEADGYAGMKRRAAAERRATQMHPDRQFTLDNLDEAIRLVGEQPASLFSFDAWRQSGPCGISYCTAGLLATSLHFIAIGWGWSHPDLGGVPTVQGRWVYDASRVVDYQLGPNAFARLLAVDTQRGEASMSDKDAALRRLRKQRRTVSRLHA